MKKKLGYYEDSYEGRFDENDFEFGGRDEDEDGLERYVREYEDELSLDEKLAEIMEMVEHVCELLEEHKLCHVEESKRRKKIEEAAFRNSRPALIGAEIKERQEMDDAISKIFGNV